MKATCPKSVRELMVQVLKQCKIWTVGDETLLHIGHQKLLLVKYLRAKTPVTQSENVLAYGTEG